MSTLQKTESELVGKHNAPDDLVTDEKRKHPKGLYLLFFTELWERFSYYGMRGLLVLYLTKTAMEGGLGFDPGTATLIYGYFTGFVYFTPIIGGWLADRFIGQRRAILIGGLLMALGQFSLASTPTLGVNFTYLGLLLLIIGNGFFKPNISTIVGNLYEQGDPRRDSAFTIFYMGINIGAFLAPLVCGYLAEDYFATKTTVDGVEVVSRYGFEYGFLAAGIGMILGQIIFNLFAPKLLGNLGLKPVKEKPETDASGKVVKKKLSKEEIDRMSVIFIVSVFVVFFWAGFEQAGSSLTLYTDKYIDREVFGWLIPTSWFQSVNPLFIVGLAPLTAMLWTSLAKKGKDLSIPVKMGLGMILLGVGFFFMVGAVMERGGDVADTTIKASIMWLLATYFFHTVGELFLSPIGLSMITRLAPVQYASMLMGVWFLSPFIAQIAGGYIASYVEELGALTIFTAIGAFVIVAGFLLILLTRKLMYMMHGRG
ncbi:MAG: peptide MFS transporter [Hymenobacteraceae bacterium]|nr:peptide MFS transporter [Hymenobacteraceae bacterium]MDX5397191.1 peptide MFS transporter [Hymenobacteraceae bacterium]MDX5442861.1 peptide MFS transporter [Hymenobacteraceae bacterium]MDX5513267.1 peptide MFS transporter [Hymenobacteraceae bacterium]